MSQYVDVLDEAVDIIAAWFSNDAKRRQAVAHLEALIDDCRAAIKVWAGYLENPGAPGDRFSIISWVGPDRANRLQDIDFQARERIMAVAELAGTAAGSGLGRHLVANAYRILKPGETGPQAAEASIGELDRSIAHLESLIERLRKTGPARPLPAPKTAAARPKAKAKVKSKAKAKAKATPKEPVRKAAKAAAKKKTAKKAPKKKGAKKKAKRR